MGHPDIQLDEDGRVAWPDFSVSDDPNDSVLCDEITGWRDVAVSRVREFEAFARVVASLGLS